MISGINNFTKYKGMTLLEVLISIVVLSFGMLGIASMLMLSNKSNNSSYAKQMATQAVYNIFDKIRANPKAAIAGNYNVSNIGGGGAPTAVSAPGVMCNAATCTGAQMASYDTWSWLTNDVAQLPNGSGSITTAVSGVAGNTIVTVTVQWDDSIAKDQLGVSSTQSANASYVQLRVQSQI